MHMMYNAAITVQKGGTVIERITVNPRVHFGKPCVAGTRITVQSVLELLDEGLSFEEIIEDYYPDLAIQDIQACIQYAIALVAAEEIHLTAVPA